MKKRLIAFLLIAAFTFEQTNVITAFADEKDGYVPLYDAYGNEVNYTDESFTGKDESGNYLPLYKSNGDEVDYQEKLESSNTTSSNTTSSNSSSSSSTASTYVPLYDAEGNEVNYTDPAFTGYTEDGKYIPLYDGQKNEVDYLGRLEDGSADTTPVETFAPYVPLYDAEGNEVNYKELIEEFYTTRDKAFKYIPLYDAEGNEVDWCGLLENTDEWNANGLYTVTFIDSFDNSVIDTYIVPADGKIDELPAAPTHDGYTFLDYIGNYLTVNQNEIVTAVYLESTAKLDVFGYIGENTDDFYEFYIYGTRINSDGVLSKDLSQVQLSLNDYTWIDEMGNTFTPNEKGNFVNQNGNEFILSKDSELPQVTVDVPVEAFAAAEADAKSATESASKSSSTDTVALKTAKQNEEATKAAKEAAKTVLKSTMDYISAICPEFRMVAGPLGALFDMALGTKVVTNDELKAQLDEIGTQIDSSESRIKTTVADVAIMTNLGSQFQEVHKATLEIKNAVGDITYAYSQGKITKDQYDKKIGALYNDSRFTSLQNALGGATLAYQGDVSVSTDKKSIFDAAYNNACDKVMFSGEALDVTTPYLITQLEIYIEGYTYVNLILDGYDNSAKYDATHESRNTMITNLNKVAELYKKYYEKGRFVFVDSTSDSSKHVRLKGELITYGNYFETVYPQKYWGKDGEAIERKDELLAAMTPKEIKEFPLNKTQMERLCKYATGKNKSLLVLLHDVGFIFPSAGIVVTLPTGVTETTADTYYDVFKYYKEDSVYMPAEPQNIYGSWSLFQGNFNSIDIFKIGKKTNDFETVGITGAALHDLERELKENPEGMVIFQKE